METTTVTFEQCKVLWDKYNAGKDRVEQHDFLSLLLIDQRFTPLFADLEKNWDPEHGRVFVNALRQIMDHFGMGQ